LHPQGRSRRLKLAALSGLGVLALVALTALLTTHLTTRAVEDRLHAELKHTAGLLGGSGFPLGDPALERVSDFIDADVVATSADGVLLATNLTPQQRDAFTRARAAGALPTLGDSPRVGQALVAGRSVTVGVAPLGDGSRGAVYVLYPEDLVAQQARAAWVPVTGVAVIASLLAVALGVWSERRVQRERNQALLRLLATVGHEVRNPLGAIRTLAELLERRLEQKGDPAGPSLAMIASEAERLILLIEGLRAVGLPVRAIRRDTDPDASVDAVLTLLAHQLEHRRVRVERGPSARASVVADPAQIRQVVLNLVLNAADAMPSGGEVRLCSHVAGDQWRLTVEDRGPGVTPALRERLFDAFVTSKDQGLGVGLFLSRRLVEVNRGSLRHDPSYTGGARFVLELPVSPSPEGAEAPDAAGGRPATA
jgi:signal transduction histidine kinase